MKLQDLKEGVNPVTDKNKWVDAMVAAGVEEFVTEVVTDEEREGGYNVSTELVYALTKKRSRLIGNWSPKKKEGMVYKGKKGDGMSFDKRHRKFKKVKM